MIIRNASIKEADKKYTRAGTINHHGRHSGKHWDLDLTAPEHPSGLKPGSRCAG
jgi:hypothetical protein